MWHFLGISYISAQQDNNHSGENEIKEKTIQTNNTKSIKIIIEPTIIYLSTINLQWIWLKLFTLSRLFVLFCFLSFTWLKSMKSFGFLYKYWRLSFDIIVLIFYFVLLFFRKLNRFQQFWKIIDSSHRIL